MTIDNDNHMTTAILFQLVARKLALMNLKGLYHYYKYMLILIFVDALAIWYYISHSHALFLSRFAILFVLFLEPQEPKLNEFSILL